MVGVLNEVYEGLLVASHIEEDWLVELSDQPYNGLTHPMLSHSSVARLIKFQTVNGHTLLNQVLRTLWSADVVYVGVWNAAWKLYTAWRDGYRYKQNRINNFLFTAEAIARCNCRKAYENQKFIYQLLFLRQSTRVVCRVPRWKAEHYN